MMEGMTLFQGITKGFLRGFLLGATMTLTAPCITQELTPQEKRMDKLSSENREYFRQLDKELQLDDFYVPNQEGENIEIKLLIKKSAAGPKAKAYAKDLARMMWILRNDEKYETLDQKIELAKETIEYARAEIQRKEHGGFATYTLGYEYDNEKKVLLKDEAKRADYEKFTKSRPINSTQTFDEFLGPKDGKEFMGDCDDFSMALTTIYHSLDDYVNESKEDDEFFQALAEGLKYYRITSIEVVRHAMNLGVSLHESGPSYEIIEPQNVNADMNFMLKGGKPFITYPEAGGCQQADNKVLKIYNRDFSAKLPEIVCGGNK